MEKKAPPEEESLEEPASPEFDPSQICDLSQMAERVAIAQETSQHWPWIAGVQHSLDWIHSSTGCPWSDPSIALSTGHLIDASEVVGHFSDHRCLSYFDLSDHFGPDQELRSTLGGCLSLS